LTAKRECGGSLVIISGPSGSGKSTLCRRLAERKPYALSVSATTRSPRPGEKQDGDYHFISREAFLRKIESGEFLEYSEHFGSLYGTPRKPVEEALRRGEVVVLEIDVNGAQQVKENPPCARRPFMIFVRAPDEDELRRRLTQRDKDKGHEAVRERLARLDWELSMRNIYDREVVNDNLDRAVAELEQIIESEAREHDG